MNLEPGPEFDVMSQGWKKRVMCWNWSSRGDRKPCREVLLSRFSNSEHARFALKLWLILISTPSRLQMLSRKLPDPYCRDPRSVSAELQMTFRFGLKPQEIL